MTEGSSFYSLHAFHCSVGLRMMCRLMQESNPPTFFFRSFVFRLAISFVVFNVRSLLFIVMFVQNVKMDERIALLVAKREIIATRYERKKKKKNVRVTSLIYTPFCLCERKCMCSVESLCCEWGSKIRKGSRLNLATVGVGGKI